MNVMTLEERERLAYMQGDIEKAELLAMLIVATREVSELEGKIDELEEEIDDLKNELLEEQVRSD